MHGETNSPQPNPVTPPCLRIAFVTETYPPEVNGVANTAAHLVKGMRTLGHAVQLVRPRQHAADQACNAANYVEMLVRGVPIPRYPQLKMGLPATRALVDAWRRDRPDIVHIVTEGPLGWSALRAARKLGLPTTSDFRTNFHAYSSHYGIGALYPLIAAYLRGFHNRTHLTMVPTDLLCKELGARGFNNLRVVARGVDTELFNPARRNETLRESWGIAPDDTVLLYVGRLAPEKNLEPVLIAFEQVRAVTPNTKLVFVGDGPAREDLRSRCPHAIYTGMRTGAELAAHYASGDVFLFSSLTETFGNVTLEAMASGRAVVAYDYAAAAKHIKHNVNGVLAPYGDTGAFVRQAVALASDPARARSLGERACETAAALAWDLIVEQFAGMANAVANIRGARP